MPKAIALYSGGLDSVLSVLIMKRLGIETLPVQFITEFGCSISRRSRGRSPLQKTDPIGLKIEKRYIGEAFLELVKNPKYGHGKNMNPCVDCKALMLREAKNLMIERGADFIVTGEVLGQRPMSQRRDIFPVIEREAGVEGLVLRPLCAKLLKPTIAEEKGFVVRESLYDIAGRSRKRQMALAEEFGLTDYAQPAGGCVLTDPTFSMRLKALLETNPSPSIRDIKLLRLGRHFRSQDGGLIVIGRDEMDNRELEKLVRPDDYRLRLAMSVGSPLGLAEAGVSEDGLLLAARLICRFSAARNMKSASVAIFHGNESWKVEVTPSDEREVEARRIHLR